jgi:hypothetical protein
MRTVLLAFVLCCVSLSAQTVQLVPDVITECTPPSLGRATVVWNYAGAGPVQIRIGSANGVAMTGLTRPVNSAPTDNWVSDGLIFVLVDATGQELARTTAHVRCNPFPDPIAAALAASSYFPLQVGNEWVYRFDSRVETAARVIRRVAGVRLVGDQAWYAIVTNLNATEVLYRVDAQGRIYTMDAAGHQVLYLDPTANPDPAATVKVVTRGQPLRNALGSFSDALTYSLFGGLSLETGTYIRGLGLLSNVMNVEAGSSGGFGSGLTLLYARIGGNIRFATPAVALGLSVESTDLDVSGGHVTNCAVPCYFVACGLTPGADPPGTYKPCFEARVRLENLPLQNSTAVDVDLLNAANQSIFHSSINVAAGQAQPDSILSQQLPLYLAPNAPVPPGIYRVQAKAKLSDGTDAATAIIPIQVR